MSQLEPIEGISAKIHAEKVIKKLTIAGSVEYLTSHAKDFARFRYLDDFAAELIRDEIEEGIRAISFHLENVRNALARELWQRGLGVGLYTLDELLFDAVKNGDSDPVMSVLKRLRRSERNAPGLVIFPLHSFGVLAAGLLQPFRGATYTLVRPGAGYVITLQTNNLRRTTSLIDGARTQLGVAKRLDRSLIQHWRESRGADWLERNPLLIARMTTIAGYYNEAEFLTLGRLQVITASVVMMAAMQSRRREEMGWFFSSGSINNWQTTDVNHYFVLAGGREQVLRGESVPIHNSSRVREMAGLAVDIDPRYFRRESARSARIFSSLEQLFAGYLRHSVGMQNSTIGNVHRKVMEAVTFFRRSFQPGRDDWTATISLATAFEMLLTDRFEGGVKARLVMRTQNLLRGVSGTRRYQASVEALYVARSETVHEGKASRLDLYDARQAFVLCFLEIMRRLPQLREGQPNPMARLTT